MRIFRNRAKGTRKIALSNGEAVPVICACDKVYQPELQSELSNCPRCGKVNVHAVCDPHGCAGKMYTKEELTVCREPVSKD